MPLYNFNHVKTLQPIKEVVAIASTVSYNIEKGKTYTVYGFIAEQDKYQVLGVNNRLYEIPIVIFMDVDKYHQLKESGEEVLNDAISEQLKHIKEKQEKNKKKWSNASLNYKKKNK